VARVILKPGRDHAVRGGHPWIFSGAIAAVEGDPAPGSVVEVRDAERRTVGCGMWNPRTSIAVRMLARDRPAIDDAFLRGRLAAALDLRTLVRGTDALRLVNGEGDGLPGVVVDRYGSFLVCQFLTAGAQQLKLALVEALAALVAPAGIYERSEGNVRKAEGLGPSTGVLAGEEPPAEVTVVESGRRYLADVRAGQKTGLFLDQRPNRDLVAQLARGRRVLNLFAYTGAFAIAAAQGGAREVVSVESSVPALALAESIWRLNDLPDGVGTFTRGDVFAYLRGTVPPADLVVLDPPPFARRRVDRERALTGYKEVNLRALHACAPGALLLTFSCSQHISADDLEAVVASAAADARREPRVLSRLGPGIDHPQALAHPEGRYLKGLLLVV
jgi:23S rRNA (cytosine1962-C5)-methyltransferase